MALKPSSVYAQMMAQRTGVPPTSTQLKYYQDIADVIILILKDVQVSPTGLVAPTGGGPVTGITTPGAGGLV